MKAGPSSGTSQLLCSFTFEGVSVGQSVAHQQGWVTAKDFLKMS